MVFVPLSVYMHFLNERRVEVIKEIPDCDIGFVKYAKRTHSLFHIKLHGHYCVSQLLAVGAVAAV